MKFLITWSLHEEKRHDTLAMFAQMSDDQEAAMMPEGMSLIGRWHDLVGGTGAAIYEVENASVISAYALQWNRFMDIDIVPVVDDAEAKAVGQQLVSSS